MNSYHRIYVKIKYKIYYREFNHLSSHDRVTALPTGVLQIYDVDQKDAGNYRCVAATVAHRRKSMEALLTVIPGTTRKLIFQFLMGPAINLPSLAIIVYHKVVLQLHLNFIVIYLENDHFYLFKQPSSQTNLFYMSMSTSLRKIEFLFCKYFIFVFKI